METVIIVDDEPSVLRALRRQLRASLNVVTFASADDLVGSLVWSPTAAVIDYRLANGSDGVRVLQFVRTRWPQCRRILIGAAIPELVRDRALQDGSADAVLTKPWDADALADIIRGQVQRPALHSKSKPRHEVSRALDMSFARPAGGSM